MPFCSECGAEIDRGDKFCPECGTPLEAVSKRPAKSSGLPPGVVTMDDCGDGLPDDEPAEAPPKCEAPRKGRKPGKAG